MAPSGFKNLWNPLLSLSVLGLFLALLITKWPIACSQKMWHLRRDLKEERTMILWTHSEGVLHTQRHERNHATVIGGADKGTVKVLVPNLKMTVLPFHPTSPYPNSKFGLLPASPQKPSSTEGWVARWHHWMGGIQVMGHWGPEQRPPIGCDGNPEQQHWWHICSWKLLSRVFPWQLYR